MADNNNAAPALARLGERLRVRRQGGLDARLIGWIADGYNLGYLTAEETKTRFGEVIDHLESEKKVP